ncbi:hypothetical protein G9H61_04115 [Aquirufa ecclesiirivi]|uniref:Uncharacterized protein n=1 Tax=Aquirufa ecclesiirivi TaxID=2715124 RepID=A0ABT4JED0_9BACT|nr:hypothetical protein [Aquirufa ecclesiirivi]MCZ2474616.1 hypothetical protein [Aquirufa ecclesiirivi]
MKTNKENFQSEKSIKIKNKKSWISPEINNWETEFIENQVVGAKFDGILNTYDAG